MKSDPRFKTCSAFGFPRFSQSSPKIVLIPPRFSEFLSDTEETLLYDLLIEMKMIAMILEE